MKKNIFAVMITIMNFVCAIVFFVVAVIVNLYSSYKEINNLQYVVLCQEKVQIKCNQFSLFLYRKVRLLPNSEMKIASTKAGIENRRFQFRRYKNLLHRNRHHPDYQIRVRNNPYPEDHHRSCRGLRQGSCLLEDFQYTVPEVPLQVLPQ